VTRIPALLLLVALGACAGSPEAPRSRLPIRVVTIPSRTVLALPHQGPYREMEPVVDRYVDYLEAQGIPPEGDLMAAFFDDPGKVPEAETRYEIRIPVAAGTKAEAPFLVKELPQSTTTAVTLRGDYAKIAKRYGEIYDWIDENGYEPAGPLIEVYLIHRGAGVPPSEYRTEVHVPVRVADKP
jgi:AraC family transcriptional regulator